MTDAEYIAARAEKAATGVLRDMRKGLLNAARTPEPWLHFRGVVAGWIDYREDRPAGAEICQRTLHPLQLRVSILEVPVGMREKYTWPLEVSIDPQSPEDWQALIVLAVADALKYLRP